jgi:hypothetical protein
MEFASEPVRSGCYRQQQLKPASDPSLDSLSNAVVTWLHFLQMEHYAADFLENGYDDLETVKRMGVADLDAVGVSSAHDQAFLLDAVRVLREQGGVWVYLLHASANAAAAAAGSDYDSTSGSSGVASGNSSLAVASIDSSSGGSGGSLRPNKAKTQLGTPTTNRTKAHQADVVQQQQHLDQDLICSVAQMTLRNDPQSHYSPATKAKLWNKQKKTNNGKRQQQNHFGHGREMKVS